MAPLYSLYVNAERTVLVRRWANGVIEVCTRVDAGATWGPPVQVFEEAVV